MPNNVKVARVVEIADDEIEEGPRFTHILLLAGHRFKIGYEGELDDMAQEINCVLSPIIQQYIEAGVKAGIREASRELRIAGEYSARDIIRRVDPTAIAKEVLGVESLDAYRKAKGGLR